MGEFSILVVDDGRLNSSSSSSGISEKLGCTTTIHHTKHRDSLINSTSDSQEAMILKNDIVHCAELLGNASTFFRAKDNTMAPGNISPWKDKLGKLLVDCMIMPEKASVLSRDVQFNSQTTECLPRNA